jgi:GNAT superfamily N-acetyltransferase
MKPSYTIALARPRHLAALTAIELAAASMLRGHAPASVLEERTPRADFERAQREARLWVALFGQTPVGFAHVEMLAQGWAHLQEMDVAPEHGRRGLGTALLRAVLNALARVGYQQLTLTTFRHVPWNMPFYARLGFTEILARDLHPALETIVRDEAMRGLDCSRRVVMRYRVGGNHPDRWSAKRDD